MWVNLKQMQLLCTFFMVNGRDQHTAGINAHHGSWRQVDDGDAGLADELFRLIVFMNTGQDRSWCTRSVIERELQ